MNRARRRISIALLIGVVAFGVAAPAVRAAGPSACGAGGSLASTNSSFGGIDVIDVAGGSQRTVAQALPGQVKSGSLTQPSWSPDGKWLAYGLSAYTATIHTSARLRIVSSDGSRRASVVTVPLAGAVSEVAWSPDGKRIAFGLWTQNRPVQAAAWTSGGDHTTIFVVNRNGTGLRPVLTPNATMVWGLAWAPDGRRLAFTNGYAAMTVDVVDVDAIVPLAVTVTPRTMEAWRPRWSPDGRHLAFLGNSVARLDAPNVWVTNAAGKQLRKLLLASFETPTWSPDSQWVAVAGERSGIAAANIATREIRPLTHDGDDRAAAWSPDGTRLAFLRPTVDGLDLTTIWTVDVRGGVARPVSRPGGYRAPIWCPAP